MNDGLGYIRDAIAKNGESSKVEVVRWEKDQKTGYYSRPFKVIIKADIALRELQKPLSKRSTVWRHIRPLGMSMDGNINAPQSVNRLNSPDLIEQLKAELRAEMAAEAMQKIRDEVKDELEKEPKKKKKAEVVINEPTIENENTDLASL